MSQAPEQAPLFACRDCGQMKPHDIQHFTIKWGYVRKREWGKMPTEVCKACLKAKVSRAMTEKWQKQHEYQAMRDRELIEQARLRAMVAAEEASHAPKLSPEELAKLSAEERERAESKSGTTLAERKAAAAGKPSPLKPEY
jgi:hypothetical protein